MTSPASSLSSSSWTPTPILTKSLFHPTIYLLHHGRQPANTRYGTWSFLVFEKPGPIGTLHRITTTTSTLSHKDNQPPRPTSRSQACSGGGGGRLTPPTKIPLDKPPTHLYCMEEPREIDFTRIKHDLERARVTGMVECQCDLEPHLVFKGAAYLTTINPITTPHLLGGMLKLALTRAFDGVVKDSVNAEWSVSQKWALDAIKRMSECGFALEEMTVSKVVKMHEEFKNQVMREERRMKEELLDEVSSVASDEALRQ